MEAALKARVPATSEIVGEYLSSVTFVMDYLQLDFNGAYFTIFIWPEVVQPSGTLRHGEAGYLDALCGLIAKNVTAISTLTGDELVISFETGTILRTSLRDEDYVGPEALHFQARGSLLVVV